MDGNSGVPVTRGLYGCWGASKRLRRFSRQCQVHGRQLGGACNSGSIRVLGCLQTLGKRYVAVACNSASIRVLGCLETPSAFLEAVPSAWTVTQGVVDALREVRCR